MAEFTKTTIHSYTQKMEALGFRDEDFYVCPILSQWELMTPKVGPFLAKGHDFQDLCKAPHKNAAYQI